MPGGGPGPINNAAWSPAELQDAIRAANGLMQVARARLSSAAQDDRAAIEPMLAELQQWVGNGLEDINVRTPQIRNLHRGVVAALLAAHLVDVQEAQRLSQGR
jgi:hypothetical protein